MLKTDKCKKCGAAIIIHDGQETLVKVRMIKIVNGKKLAKCTKCKTF
ncbi:hypothetical protein HOG75_03175, partial [bacterium]|nr:hypothetical protein [bacterium]